MARVRPFCIGDLDPSGSFVHDFNEFALDIVMRELDTVTDFVDYLDKKERLVRSGRLLRADGEENLLAYYAIRINEDGEHDFTPVNRQLQIECTHYVRFITDPQYIAKKKADEISYLWDDLIQSFTNHMLAGTSVTIGNYGYQLKENEIGVRFMALECRFFRRSLGKAIKGALKNGAAKDTFFRMMMRREGAETAFFILTVRCQADARDAREYEKYRIARTGLAEIYAKGILERHGYLKRVIGIALEPSGQKYGVSEDLVYVEQAAWTEEERSRIREVCQKLGIFRPDMK